MRDGRSNPHACTHTTGLVELTLHALMVDVLGIATLRESRMTSYYFSVSGSGVSANNSGMDVCRSGAGFLDAAIADGRLPFHKPKTAAYEALSVPGDLLIELVQQCFDDRLRVNGERANVEALVELLDPASYYGVEYGDI